MGNIRVMGSVKHIAPDFQRNNRVRAAFIAKGTSFHAFCKASGFDSHNARKAVLGIWTGPKAKVILVEVLQASGVTE